jgi:hypothetical protein
MEVLEDRAAPAALSLTSTQVVSNLATNHLTNNTIQLAASPFLVGPTTSNGLCAIVSGVQNC